MILSFSLPLAVDADVDAYVIKLDDEKCLVQYCDWSENVYAAVMLLCHLAWYKFLFTTNRFEREKKTTQKTLFIAIVWAYSTIPMTSTTIHVLSGNIYTEFRKQNIIS